MDLLNTHFTLVRGQALAVEGTAIAEHGWAFVLTAVIGAALLVVAAAVLNNALPDRRYPQGWIGN